jgi:hypothetical protein
MGFALWVDGDLAWAEGTHEYRPMGTAVVAATTQFVQRDFRPAGARRRRADRGFEGLFGSLVEVNHWLARRRAGRAPRRPPPGPVLSYF